MFPINDKDRVFFEARFSWLNRLKYLCQVVSWNDKFSGSIAIHLFLLKTCLISHSIAMISLNAFIGPTTITIYTVT